MYMVNHERIAQEMYDEIVICYNVSTVGQYCSCLPKKKNSEANNRSAIAFLPQQKTAHKV